MGLFLVLVVILAIQHGLTQDVSSLPRLQGNKLHVGAEVNLPQGTEIICGGERLDAGRFRSLTLSEALTTDNFKNRPFTSGLISSPKAHQISGEEARFKIVEIKARRYLYALQVDPSGERAYWLNQSIFRQEPYPVVNLPEHPTADQPKYVFTPDFSGCSWTVTPLGNGFLRLRHVAGSQEDSQFNDLPSDKKGGTVSYAMQYRDYGYTVERDHLAENVHSFAYMHYSGGRWTLHLQRKACCPAIGMRTLTNGMLSSVTLRDTINSNYFSKPITSTKDYIIPKVSFVFRQDIT